MSATPITSSPITPNPVDGYGILTADMHEFNNVKNVIQNQTVYKILELEFISGNTLYNWNFKRICKTLYRVRQKNSSCCERIKKGATLGKCNQLSRPKISQK